MENPIVQDARGLILDSIDNWKIVAWSFSRFFNFDDPLAAKIDWSTARIETKMDGSLIQFYYYDEGWNVSTSGSPDAGGSFGSDKDHTFADVFRKVWKENGYNDLRKNYTYMFELTGPGNRVVCQYKDVGITLIGMRNMDTMKEERPKLFRVPVTKSWSVSDPNIEKVMAQLMTLNPLAEDGEGFVVVDGNFNRVKVKNPKYVMLHRLRDTFSPKNFLEAARQGDTVEIRSAFPEYAGELDKYEAKLNLLSLMIDANYQIIQGIEDRKAFAAEAVKTTCPAALFQLKDKKVKNGREFLNKLQIDKLMEMVEKS